MDLNFYLNKLPEHQQHTLSRFDSDIEFIHQLKDGFDKHGHDYLKVDQLAERTIRNIRNLMPRDLVFLKDEISFIESVLTYEEIRNYLNSHPEEMEKHDTTLRLHREKLNALIEANVILSEFPVGFEKRRKHTMKTFWTFYWIFLLLYSAVVFSWILRDLQDEAVTKRQRQREHAKKLAEILTGTRKYLPEENIQNIERLIAKWK